jgi:hypothetical protein
MRGTPQSTDRDAANAGRKNLRPRENAHARFSLSVGHAQRMPKTKKKPNDASIKNFLCRINIFSSMLWVAMTKVGSMRRIENNTPPCEYPNQVRLSVLYCEPTQYKSIKGSDAMKQTLTAVTSNAQGPLLSSPLFKKSYKFTKHTVLKNNIPRLNASA